MTLILRNPHSVLAALRMRPLDVLDVQLPLKGGSPAWQEVATLARQQQIPVRITTGPVVERGRERRGPDKQEREGVAQASVRDLPGVSLDVLFTLPVPTAATETANAPATAPFGLWLALDCLQDPHNVGAIFRTAAFFGVRGIVLTRDRSAPLTGTVYDVAAGGLEGVPFAQPANLSQSLQFAKEQGLWILGASEHATRPLSDIPRDRHWLVVVGNEEHGLRRLTLDLCDDTCGIPARGPVGSLNVSVATGVLLSHLCR